MINNPIIKVQDLKNKKKKIIKNKPIDLILLYTNKKTQFIAPLTKSNSHLRKISIKIINFYVFYLYKLASKIDFFNPFNQKRLDIQKRKVFVDLGIIKKEKPPVFCTKKISKSSL